jgi:hypothetical protein
MFFLGLSGFWTKAQNEENKNLLYSVRWLLVILLYIITKLLIMENHPSQIQKQKSDVSWF